VPAPDGQAAPARRRSSTRSRRNTASGSGLADDVEQGGGPDRSAALRQDDDIDGVDMREGENPRAAAGGRRAPFAAD